MHRDRITEAKVSSYSKDRNFTFRGEQAWHPLDNATPSNFLFPKSLDQELSADVTFVSVLAMVLSEYWKLVEENFGKRLFPRYLKNYEIYKNIFSRAFSSILKEPLLVQKQTLHQQKALDFRFFLAPWKWAWHCQEGVMPIWRKKHFVLIFYRCVERFWLFAFYDIVTPSW